MTKKMSKGEEKIAKLLKDNKIPFVQEYSFKDLKNKGVPLRYDFMIISRGAPYCAIEFDGEQHFRHIPFFGDFSHFKHMQENDRRKNSYALSKGFRLIRVPYWEIDNLTFFSLFNTLRFIVRDKWHNDKIGSDFLK